MASLRGYACDRSNLGVVRWLGPHWRVEAGMRRRGYVYILTNKGHSALYTGVTSDLVKRVYEHRAALVDSFTKRYKLTKLIYYEIFDEIEDAIAREKQIKGGSRTKKLQLINGMNPDWKDLYEDL